MPDEKSRRAQGEEHSVNTVGARGSYALPSSRPGTPSRRKRLVAQRAAVHHHSVLVDSLRCLWASEGNAAGGAVSIDAAGILGSGTARDEGIGRPVFWQARVTWDDCVVSGMSRQMKANAGNTATSEYESRSMYEDKPARNLRGGQYQGRAVHAASVLHSSVSSANREAARAVDVPALGVMGGLHQSVSSPTEPPVSSLPDPSSGPRSTAPAPFADFPAGDVSPQADAGGTAVGIASSRPPGRIVSPSGQGRKSCPPAL
jgi:hypothetical protein